MLSSAQAEFDVWGFGCVLYQLCTGRPLFMEIDSSDDNIIDDKRARLALRNWTEIDNERLSFVFEEEKEGGAPGRSVSTELAQDLIRECLQGDPKKRLASMAQVLAHPFLNEEARTAEITRRASLEEVGTRGATRKGKNAKDAADALTPTKVYPDGSYAVLIGINDYESSGISPDEGGMADLKSARQDAELVRDTLRARGFTILGELYDKEATKAGMNELLDNVQEKLEGKSRSRLVFFLASHGILVKNDGLDLLLRCQHQKALEYVLQDEGAAGLGRGARLHAPALPARLLPRRLPPRRHARRALQVRSGHAQVAGRVRHDGRDQEPAGA